MLQGKPGAGSLAFLGTTSCRNHGARHDERLSLAPQQQDGVEVEPLTHLAERIRVGITGRVGGGVEKGMGQLAEQSLEVQPRGHVVKGVAPFVDCRRQREVRQRRREDQELDADQRRAGRGREERAVAMGGRDDGEERRHQDGHAGANRPEPHRRPGDERQQEGQGHPDGARNEGVSRFGERNGEPRRQQPGPESGPLQHAPQKAATARPSEITGDRSDGRHHGDRGEYVRERGRATRPNRTPC